MNAIFSPLPEEWPKIALRYLAHCQLGKAIAAQAVAADGKYPVFRAVGVGGYTSQYNYSGQYVLITMRGSHCGDVYFASGEFWASEQVMVVQAKAEVCDVRWLELALRSMNLKQHTSGTSVPSLSIARMQDLTIAAPPLAQQRQIASYVADEMRRMDAVIGEMETVIALTKDRRIALTQAAAAGQIRMKEIAL